MIRRKKGRKTRAERLIVNIIKVKSPLWREDRGRRIVAVIPNKAKYNVFTGEYTTSYHPRYRVYEDGDYTPNSGDLPISLDIFMRFLRDHNLRPELLDTSECVQLARYVDAILEARAQNGQQHQQQAHG